MGSALWSSGESDRLSFKSWADDELGLVFDALTGDTHLLDHSALEILQCLRGAPSTVDALGAQMADRFLPDEQGKIAEFIATTLLQLRGIGLAIDTPV
jgi:PqqD family protein of HPr-rel-A system